MYRTPPSQEVLPNGHSISGSSYAPNSSNASNYQYPTGPGSSSGSSSHGHRANRASHSSSEMSYGHLSPNMYPQRPPSPASSSISSIPSQVVAASLFPQPTRNTMGRRQPTLPPIPQQQQRQQSSRPSLSPASPVSTRPPPSVISSSSRESHTFEFEQVGYNLMKLVPSYGYEDPTIPRYFVTVSMNCFNPNSFITVINRGENEQGEYVAEFE